MRVLIIDDCSPDDTPQVGERLAAADQRVEFRRHAVNKGHIATYNEGLLDWTRADYSLLLSADDALAPGALARATRLMDRHRDVAMSYGMALIVTQDQSLELREQPSEESQILSSAQFLQRCCVNGNPVPTPTAVVRTALQHQLGGYRADLPHTGDMEMWMRFAAHGRIGVFRAVQGYYRWHDKNMSSAAYADLLNDQRERLKACNEAIGRCATSFPESSAWLSSARRQLSEEAFWLASRAFDAGDTQASSRCLSFALEIYPELRNSGAWQRFRYKKLLGQPLWSRVLPLLQRLRGQQPRADGSRSRFRPGQVNGWWPETA